MAGGWDGDALAEQMEDALERQQAAADDRRHNQHKETSSSDERVKASELESLRLSKARIMNQLNQATNPTHRAMLERALQSLESQAEEEA